MNQDLLAQAARWLRDGELVAFPTETVYGLGANASNPAAVTRLYQLKARPLMNPLIVHGPDTETVRQWVAEFPPQAQALARRFWPGPLTLVLPKRPIICDLVTAGLPTVGIRVPRHPLALQLLRDAGVPVAAPSANAFTRVSPTTAAHVREAFGDSLAVVDGGPCAVGVESTIVGWVDGRATLLRPGGVTREEIEPVIGPLALPKSGGPHLAPGMMKHHYAPRTPLAWRGSRCWPDGAQIGLLTFGPPVGSDRYAEVHTLSAGGDLAEACRNLFAMLRQLDASGLTGIEVDSLPDHGLGYALNDRLRRAMASPVKKSPR